MKKDSLGNRMKEFYESRTRTFLPRRTYTIIRIDGKAFHTYTQGLTRPFDENFINDMDETACYLCKSIQGAKFAFVQSDEISILITDFDNLQTDAWFDGNIQKIVSVAASMATSKFNQLRWMRYVNERYNNTTDTVSWDWFEGMRKLKLAEFDARIFTVPSKSEVANTFIWRQIDTVRNSISSVAQSLYSHKELNNKNTSDMQEMIHQKGQNWNDYPIKLKRGRFIDKQIIEIDGNIRTNWVSIEPPIFTQEPDFLMGRIPDNN
jgi:tRNA(His) 5'-end guanylyltransferase